MDLVTHTLLGIDRILNGSSKGPQQPMPGNPALVERPSPTDDAGTAGAVTFNCERCRDTKLVTLYGTYMGDADEQPCPECE